MTLKLQEWLDARVLKTNCPQNGEEAALSRAGPELYEKIFKHYTYKQWEKYPAELDASVLLRIPVRLNTDDRYFTDTWQVSCCVTCTWPVVALRLRARAMQALPTGGYTALFEKMLDHPLISVCLSCDFFEVRTALRLLR